MDIEKMLSEMTNEQAYRIIQKSELHARAIEEPDWSKNEGHWDRATKNSIVDGTGPERHMKRDEVIAVLGRLGIV